jgi:hypothetical protein
MLYCTGFTYGYHNQAGLLAAHCLVLPVAAVVALTTLDIAAAATETGTKTNTA